MPIIMIETLKKQIKYVEYSITVYGENTIAWNDVVECDELLDTA